MTDFKIEKPKGGQRVLIFDLETAPLKTSIWSARQKFIPYAMMERDWYLMSYSAKWLGNKHIMYKDLRHLSAGSEDDRELILELYSLISSADVVIAHNGDKFDVPSLNTRFLHHGLTPPPPYHSVDTYKVARQNFRLPYYSLQYLTETFLPEQYWKRKSEKFVGHTLWVECERGNPEAWDEMEAYNRQDVVALEALYWKFRPWIKGHPNMGTMHGDAPDILTCPNCGSHKIQRRGFQHTKLSGVFQRLKCLDCGKWGRSRTTITTPSKRHNIMIG